MSELNAPLPPQQLLLYTFDVFVVEIGKRNHGADKQEQESQFDIHDRALRTHQAVLANCSPDIGEPFRARSLTLWSLCPDAHIPLCTGARLRVKIYPV